MPKETIPSIRVAPQPSPALEIGWGKGGNVISVRTDDAPRWAHLDGDSVNRLVRVLQKARDQSVFADRLALHDAKGVALVATIAAARGWKIMRTDGFSPVDGLLMRDGVTIAYDAKTRAPGNEHRNNIAITPECVRGWRKFHEETGYPILIVADDSKAVWLDDLEPLLIKNTVSGFYLVGTTGIRSMPLYLADVLDR